jgi:hypothetical protein
VKDGDLHVFCGFIKNLSGDGAGSQRDLLSTSSESPGASPSPDGGRPHSFGAANVSAWRFKSAGAATGVAAAAGSASPVAASPAAARAGSDDSIPWHQRTQLPPGSSSYWAELPGNESGGTDSGEVVAVARSGAGSGTTSPLSSIGSSASDSSVTVITASSVPPKKLSGLEQCREIAFDELKFAPDKMIGRGAFASCLRASGAACA